MLTDEMMKMFPGKLKKSNYNVFLTQFFVPTFLSLGYEYEFHFHKSLLRFVDKNEILINFLPYFS